MQCNHLPPCGGCFYKTGYKSQIALKKEFLHNLFDEEIELITSPITRQYRSRMDFVYAFDRIGLRARGTFKHIVEIQKCHLMSDRMNAVLNKIQLLVKKYQIPSYDFVKHVGYLRYVTLRETSFSKKLMIVFLTSSKEDLIEPLLKDLEKDSDSIIWSVNKGPSDINIGKIYKVIGTPTIQEKFDNIKYKISANTFFQSNAWIAKKIYQEIKKNVSGTGLDLYCGIGSISLFIADKCEEIIGVDEIEQSIELAKENAILNNISDTTYISKRVKTYINQNLDQSGKNIKADSPLRDLDFVIVDPPRSGLEKKMCKKLLILQPKRIIYLSCGPKTLKSDLNFLKEKYRPVYQKAFDMFPHTDHVEILTVLDRTK